MTQSDPSAEVPGATVVISHRVRPDRHEEYEWWLDTIAPLVHRAEGNLDWHIIRPVRGLTDTYTVIIRFDTAENLARWIDSPKRRELVAELQPLLAEEDRYTFSGGLDFWFPPKAVAAAVPARWKQYLLTWSAIFPLACLVPLLTRPLLQAARVPGGYLMENLAATALIVFLMVYVVMPRYTAFARRWLYG